MSKENVPLQLSNGSGKNLSAPPGFASLTSFRLKRVTTIDENSKELSDVSKDDPTQIDNVVLERCFLHRPWIVFDPINRELDESDSEKSEKDFLMETYLPKGVIRGCPDCSDCLKVQARWRPEDARKDVIEDAPVYYPTEKEFEDTVKYIAEIRKSSQQYGICRIVPPPSWNPPCVIQEKKVWENYRFVTRVQRIDGMQVPYSKSETDHSVEYVTGKRRRTLGRGSDFGCLNGDAASCGETRFFETQRLESLHGPEFTLETFKKYADDFKDQYFCASEITNANYSSSTVSRGTWEPSVENIEGEYKRIVDNPTEEIEVLCCDGSETRIFSTGFPTMSETSPPEIVNSPWNLNNVPNLPGSLLSSESSHTSLLLVPRVQLGMCFSTLHWRVEEHHLNALCYLPLGAHKIWYGVPPRGGSKFEMALKNSSTDGFDKQNRLIKHLSLSALMSNGIPVFRCVQNPREFVLIFPGVYHSGFDSGFNFSETANFAPLDWLPHGQNAIELYRDLRRKTSLSHEKLLLQAASAAIKAQWELSLCRKDTTRNQFWKDACGKQGILTNAVKLRVQCEEVERKFLCSSSTRMMEEEFDGTNKRECKICHYDLHFSAAGCPCSPDVYSCLQHAEKLCSSCAWTDKFFLFRHDISHLNLLVEALEGKLNAIFKYAKENLGLTLSSVSRISLTTVPEDHPASPSCADTPAEEKYQSGATRNSSSIREEIKARLLQSTVSKKTTEKEPPAAKAFVSNRNLSTFVCEPSESSSQAEAKQKAAAPEVASAANERRCFPDTKMVVGDAFDTSESSSDETDGDPEVVLKAFRANN